MYMFQMMNKPSEAIEKLLSDKNTTIEDLLREEELLQELRNKNNKKLIEYFDKEKIKKLLDYIIKEPEIKEEDLDSKENREKGLKFPFLCSQIFDLRIDELFQYFFMTNEEIEKKENEKNNKEKDIEPKDKEKGPEDSIKKEIKQKIPDDNIKKEGEDKIPEDNNAKDTIDTKNKENKKEEEQKPNEVNKESGDNKKKKKKNEVENKGNDNKEGNESQQNKPKDYKIELLDYLFSFLPKEIDEKNKLNYVLCGYFNSLIINLLNVNPTVFLNYVYNIRKDVFDLLIKNSYRKSISETLSQILHFENYDQNNSNGKNMSEIRLQILEKIFKEIDMKKDNEEINSIYYLITGLYDSTSISDLKKCFENMIENENIINCLFKPFEGLDLNSNSKTTENKRQNFMVIIDIIIFLLTNIKTVKCEIPTYNEESKNTKHTKLSKKILDILPKLISNNFKNKNKASKISLSFDEFKLIPFGEYKIKIVELIRHSIPYFKKASKDFDNILKNSQFFKIAFEYIDQYQWNNIYQESFLSLLKTLFDQSAHHELLVEYLFNKIKINKIIKDHTDEGNKFKFKKKESNPISNGYISFFVSLCYKINTVIGGTPLKVNKNPSTEGSFEFIYSPDEDNNKRDIWNENVGSDNNKEEEEEKGVPIKSMEKYITAEWKDLFEKNIKKTIEQYCDREWPKVEKTTDIFDFLFQEGDDSKKNEEENKSTNEENRKNIEDGNNFINNNGQEVMNNVNINPDEKKEENEEVKEVIKKENKEEVKGEIKNEEKKNNKEENKDENKEEKIEEKKEENQEVKKEELKEENKEELKEENKEKMKENKEELKEEKKEELKEEKKEELKEEKKEELKEENKEEVKEEKKEKVIEDNKNGVKKENRNEVKKEEVKKDMKKEVKKEDNKKGVKNENKNEVKKEVNKKEVKKDIKKEVKKGMRKDNKKEVKKENKKEVKKENKIEVKTEKKKEVKKK